METGALSKPAVRVRNEFEFTIPAAWNEAAPLFGAEAERAWAGDDWNPQFLFPIPARDTEGMVFTVARNHSTGVWINTIFDPEHGRMQYIYFIPDVLVTRIDVHLTETGENRTHVRVAYERTALSIEAGDRVRAMGEHDAVSGPEWQHSIESYLNKRS